MSWKEYDCRNWYSYGFFFQAEDGIRDLVRSRGLGDVYKRQVLIWGRTPSSTTLRISTPTGVPRKPRAGMVKAVCSAVVISYMARVVFKAISGVPPMKVTMAGAVAIANAPIPAVSVMVLSPISPLALSLIHISEPQRPY